MDHGISKSKKKGLERDTICFVVVFGSRCFAFAQRENLEVLDARVLYDGNSHAELADQLHGSNTRHVLVITQPSLQ